jgi:hypothetical protein
MTGTAVKSGRPALSLPNHSAREPCANARSRAYSRLDVDDKPAETLGERDE